MYRKYTKRFFDILGCVIILPFFLLIYILVAIAIKIDDGDFILYEGERIGLNGKIFRMYKFRTMRENAEDIRNADGTTYNSSKDPRLTRIGGFLRASSIDEIPQIINILVGQMSFIGPRPDLPDQKGLYKDSFDEWKLRVSVRPGITGYSQAYYRNSVNFMKRLDLDLYYVEHMSCYVDLKIIIQTFNSIVHKKNVYKNTDRE
jgi:lipopolysaccharide/colanic/teichoic acid biosynthesis glycosyltransferase